MCYGNLFSYPLFFFFGISTVPGDDFGLIPRFLFLGFVGFLKNCLSVWFGEWVGSKIRFLVKRTEEFSYSCEHVPTLSLKIGESLLTILCVYPKSTDCFWIVNEDAKS